MASSPALGHNKYIKNSLWAFLPKNQSLLHTTNTKHSHEPRKRHREKQKSQNTRIEKAIAIAFKFIQYYKSRAWAEMLDLHH